MAASTARRPTRPGTTTIRPASAAAPTWPRSLALLAALAGCSKARETPPPPPAPDSAIAPAAPAPTAEITRDAETPAPPPEPKKYKLVLHAGDSTVGTYKFGLARALGDHFKAEGTRYVYETWESASLTQVAAGTRLNELIAKWKPDLVILTLGTNDAYVPAPWALEWSIRSIARKVGDRDCYWIGPPLWKKDVDAGLVGSIRENVAPCRFFDSGSLTLERRADGIHPTDKGGQVWADAFWLFLRAS
jgi:hypothetical protein